MKIYCIGTDPLWSQPLRDHGYDIVIYQDFPSSEVVYSHALLFSDADVPPKELHLCADKYPNAKLLYHYTKSGISGWQGIALACKQLDIHFIRPGIGIESLKQLLDLWFEKPIDAPQSVVGVFGVVPGIGTTSIAALIARSIPQRGVMLGLNLFNPGWDKPASTLDNWRMRLIQQTLNQDDFKSMVSIEKFKYLPGNTDPLLTMDYTEDEITYLVGELSKKQGVVSDYGAIPHTAAWVHGVQRSSVRIMVSHPRYVHQLERLMQLSGDLGVDPEHWMLMHNRVDQEDITTRDIAQRLGMQVLSLSTLPTYKERTITPFFLPISKKEQEQLQPISAVLGG